jgi:hypothetical protein
MSVVRVCACVVCGMCVGVCVKCMCVMCVECCMCVVCGACVVCVCGMVCSAACGEHVYCMLCACVCYVWYVAHAHS